MARMPKAWRRKGVGGGKGAWYTTLEGRQVWLAPASATVTQAEGAHRQLVRAPAAGATPEGLTVASVVKRFLDERRQRVKDGAMTLESYQGCYRFTAPFGRALAAEPAGTLAVGKAEEWVRSHPGWNPTTRARATEMVKACFRWAKRSGLLAENPLAEMTGPKALRREAVITRDQAERLIANAGDRHFSELLQALLWTGCRPKEVWTLTADRVDLKAGTWRVLDKIRHRTGEDYRTVHLNDEARALSRRLVAENPDGPVFLNSRGRPWSRSAIGHRLIDLRGPMGIGKEGVAYAFRHLFATDLLEKGVPPATVATLLGHRSLDMVMRIYSHLGERTEHLRDAVRKTGHEAA
jgi:integrase/recombinase XerD